ncbi:hypothetical protein lerEdw1_006572 [Lerista edwardsae]|nr:hypothetical protein lerEdw1_006572 [Lerista edwardsae]
MADALVWEDKPAIPNQMGHENQDRLPSMDLLIGIVLFTVLSFGLCDAPARIVTSDLTVTNGGRWGDWGPPEFCPSGYATGFSVKGMIILVFLLGRWGTWSDVQTCPMGHLTSFTLSVTEPQGAGDDTAANNIMFLCPEYYYLTGAGHEWGEYGPWSDRCYYGSICGIQTRVESHQGAGDDTGLNDVKLFCCE